MALLLKRGALISLPKKNPEKHHLHSSKEIVQLETMMGTRVANAYYITTSNATAIVMAFMYEYDDLLDQINHNNYTIEYTNELLTQLIIKMGAPKFCYSF